MTEVPKFRLYGEGDKEILESLQPTLGLRPWSALSVIEKRTFAQELQNRNYANDASEPLLSAMLRLNMDFLRQTPAKQLHAINPQEDRRPGLVDYKRKRAALSDFTSILLAEKNDAMVMRTISELLHAHINFHNIKLAEAEQDKEQRAVLIGYAYRDFDKLASVINYLFRQFAVNQKITRSGMVPIHDAQVAERVYAPTLAALSDPKYSGVSDDLRGAFDEFRDGNYPEAISKSHSAVQRFLQIEVGEEGKNGRGELKDLFRAAKDKKLIGGGAYADGLLSALQSHFAATRANQSTAKPTVLEVKPGDASLMIDLVMVFLHHSITNKR